MVATNTQNKKNRRTLPCGLHTDQTKGAPLKGPQPPGKQSHLRSANDTKSRKHLCNYTLRFSCSESFKVTCFQVVHMHMRIYTYIDIHTGTIKKKKNQAQPDKDESQVKCTTSSKQQDFENMENRSVNKISNMPLPVFRTHSLRRMPLLACYMPIIVSPNSFSSSLSYNAHTTHSSLLPSVFLLFHSSPPLLLSI